MGCNYGVQVGKYLRVAIALIGHLFLVAVSVVGIYGLELLLAYLWDHHEPMIWDLVPLKFLFQAIDVGIVIVFGYRVVREINEILGE